MTCHTCERAIDKVEEPIKEGKVYYCSEQCRVICRRWKSLAIRIYSLKQFYLRFKFQSAV